MRAFKIQKQITVRDCKSTTLYFQDVSKQESISIDKEVELAILIREGNLDARNKLVLANLPFVISVAKQYLTRGMDFQDIVNEGNLGLIKAAERFDETKGFKFISFAVWYIRQAMGQAIVEHSKLIRLPQNLVNDISKKNKVIAEFEQKNFRIPTECEIAEIMCMEEENVLKLNQISQRVSGLSNTLDNSDDTQSLIETYINYDSQSPDDNLLKESLSKDLNTAFTIAQLKERERKVLIRVYGLGSTEPLSIASIAEELGYTTERIRQIQEEAENKLRNKITASMSIPIKKNKKKGEESVDIFANKDIKFLRNYL